jgi:hypothetical protein
MSSVNRISVISESYKALGCLCHRSTQRIPAELLDLANLYSVKGSFEIMVEVDAGVHLFLEIDFHTFSLND